jgi:acyl-CoA synthetase (AMP-forming)/AMP-acid ligase II
MPSDPVSAPTTDEQTLTDRLRRWSVERAQQRAFTFVDYPDLASPGRHRTLTWGQLSSRAEALAAQLSEVARPGDRAALMMPQGLDYVTGFLACLLARVVAVPLFPPDLPGHESRVAAVFEDCEPACALVTTAGEQLVRDFARGTAVAEVPLVVVGSRGERGGVNGDGGVNGNGDRTRADGSSVAGGAGASAGAGVSVGPAPGLDEIAYLQYTSGSTRVPAGVMISHRNVLANAMQALAAFDAMSSPATAVGWLPLFHDMGLVLSVAAPVVGGFSSVLMDPVAFLEKPERWLKLLSLYPGVLSAAPNFAYDYCASRVGPEQAAGLRLDRVRGLVNGSEPVRAETVRRFQFAFGRAGLRPEAHCPSYGLAEATVFVATDGPAAAPHEVTCRRDALTEGRIVPVERSVRGETDEVGEGAKEAVTSLVACGIAVGQELRIADPSTRAVLPDDMVGEILLRGPNIGLGYWKKSEKTAETFDTVLPGTGEQAWLRTGDLGAIHEGRLLVTGRLKDLLIADGRNHYPQDVEETLQSALTACVRRGRIAVFTVPGEEGELIVAVAEHRREVIPDDALRADADRTGRAQVSVAHGLRLDRLLLVPPEAVVRTSSGKVSRSACRTAFLRGDYAGSQLPRQEGGR